MDRRPHLVVDAQFLALRRQRRHLINRRDTLVLEIVRCTRLGDTERVGFLRSEANKVNSMISETLKNAQ